MKRWICRGSIFWYQAPRKVYSAQIHQIYPLVQKVCLISMNSWILMYAWEMVMEIWGFSLERLVVAWDLLHKLDLQKYSDGIFIIDTSCWVTSCISWHIAKWFYGTWLRSFICEVVDVVLCLDHVRDIILVYDYTHLYGTWLERDIYILGKEDVRTGYKYSLDIVTCYRFMWKKLQRVRSFQEKGNPSFWKGIRRLHNSLIMHIRGLHNK